jgi:hypothetical protein
VDDTRDLEKWKDPDMLSSLVLVLAMTLTGVSVTVTTGTTLVPPSDVDLAGPFEVGYWSNDDGAIIVAVVSDLVQQTWMFPGLVDTALWPRATARISFPGPSVEEMSTAMLSFAPGPLSQSPGLYRGVIAYSVVGPDGTERVYAGPDGIPPTSSAFLVVP